MAKPKNADLLQAQKQVSKLLRQCQKEAVVDLARPMKQKQKGVVSSGPTVTVTKVDRRTPRAGQLWMPPVDLTLQDKNDAATLQSWLDDVVPKPKPPTANPTLEKMRKRVSDRQNKILEEVKRIQPEDFLERLSEIKRQALDRLARKIAEAILVDDIVLFQSQNVSPWYMYINTNPGSPDAEILKEALKRGIDFEGLQPGLDYQVEREHDYLVQGIERYTNWSNDFLPKTWKVPQGAQHQ